MDTSFWILIGMLVVAVGFALRRGGPRLVGSGLKEAGLNLKSVWFRLILGFTLGGMVQLLIPGPLIA